MFHRDSSQHRAHTPHSRGRRVLSVLSVPLIVLSSLTLVTFPARPAEAASPDNGYTRVFFVNDVRDVADVTPGDGQCTTRFSAGVPAAPTCTLYAAIQEANASPAGDSVLIAPAPQIRQINGSFASSGVIDLIWDLTNNPTPQVPEMSTSLPADAGSSGQVDSDSVSRYWVKHNDVTLDFQNRLGWKVDVDAGANVLLFTGKRQTLRNFTDLTSAESGIYIGALAEDMTVENGRVGNPATNPALPSNYSMERGIVVVEGAKNTVLRGLRFQRNYLDSVLMIDAADTTKRIDGLTLDRNSWDQPVNGGAVYDPAWNYFLRNNGGGVNGTNVAVTNNSVKNWGADGGATDLIFFSGGQWTNVSVRGNTFRGTVNQAVSPVRFANTPNITAEVRDNTFQWAGVGAKSPSLAGSWVQTGGTTSGVRTFDNRFVGDQTTLQIGQYSDYWPTVINPTFRNIMTGVGGTGVTAGNENYWPSTANNIYHVSNNIMRTVWPSSATVPTSPPQACRVDVRVEPPSAESAGSVIPTQEIYIDAYLGRTAAAGGDGAGLEQYLGRVATTQGALPQTLSFPHTGVGAGRVLRLQTTEVSGGRTSNYSRSVAAVGPDGCAPQSWIKQGGWFSQEGAQTATQEDPTSFRNVTFDIRVSETLGTNGLVPADFVLGGTAPGQQVVSLTQVGNTAWQLVVKANGSGTIIPSLPAGAIGDVAGNASAFASNTTAAPVDFAGYSDASQTSGIPGASLDSSVQYNSPLAITGPASLALSVFEPGTIEGIVTVSNTTVDANSRVVKAPTAPVILTQQWSNLIPDPSLPNPAQTAAGIARALPTYPSINATQPVLDTLDRTLPIRVQAIDNTVVDGSRGVTLGFTVSSADPEFNGLILPTVAVTVEDNDTPSPALSALAVTQDDSLANGTAVNALTTTVRNASGVAVSNAEAEFTIPASTSWVGPDQTPGTADDVAGGPGATATILTNAFGAAVMRLTSNDPGDYSVTASVVGTEMSGSPQSVTFVRTPVNPANPASNFTVTTGDLIANDTDAHTITVNLVDADGDPAAGWEAGLTASSTPSIGVTLGAFAETENLGEYEASIVSIQSGIKDIAVTFTDDLSVVTPLALAAGGNAEARFVADEPVVGPGFSEADIDDANDRVADGSDFHRITATLIDSNSNSVTGRALSLSATVADNTDAAVAVTAFVETSTPGVYEAFVRSTEAGEQSVTVLLDGSTEIGSLLANFAAGEVDVSNPATGFDVSTGNEIVGSGSHQITVTLTDASGNPVPDQDAELNATSAASLGTGVISGFVETGTEGTYTASVSSTLAGNKSIAVTWKLLPLTSTGNTTATFIAGDVDLGNTAASNFDVSAGEVAVTIGEHAVTVRLADQYGNLVAGREDDLVADSVDDLGTGGFTAFSEISLGVYEATMTSSDSGGKVVTVELSGSSVAVGSNNTAVFVAGGVDVNNIGTRYTVSSGDELVGTGEHTITATLADEDGNEVTGAEATLKATSAGPLGTGGISAFAETGTPGTYEAKVSSSVSGNKQITVRAGAASLTVLLVGNDTARFVSAATDLTRPGTAYSVSTGNQQVGAGEHTVTITLVDSLDNPINGMEDDLEVTSPDDLGAGLIEAVTETAVPGTYEARVTSTVAGAKSFEVTFQTEAVTLRNNGLAVFVPGPVDLGTSVFSVTSGAVSIDGGEHTLTTLLRDAYGNPVTGAAARLAASPSGSLGTGSIGLITEPGSDGTYTAQITSSLAGLKTILVTFDGSALGAGGANDQAEFVAGGVDRNNPLTSFTVTGGSQVVDTGTHTITVVLADAGGNPVSGEELGLTASTLSDLGEGDFTDFVESTPLGTYTASVRSTLSGEKAIQVDFGGGAIFASGNDSAVFVAEDADPNNAGTGFSVTSGTVSVEGGAHAITVTLADRFGNPVEDAASDLLASTTDGLGTGAITSFVDSAKAGTYVANVTSSVSGPKTIEVSFDGAPLTARGNEVALFGAGVVDINDPNTTFEVTAGPQPVGTGVHTITVTLADAGGNPVTGEEGGLEGFSGGSLGTGTLSSFEETLTPGTYEASVSSTLAGTTAITVQYGGNEIQFGTNQNAEFVAGAVDLGNLNTGFAVTPGDAVAGVGNHFVTVTLADEFGNPVLNEEVRLVADTADDIGTEVISGFVGTGTPGSYRASIGSSVIGSKTITVELASQAITARGNSSARFIAGETDVSNPATGFTVTAGEQPVSASGHTLTVFLADAFGNPVTGQTNRLTAATADSLGTGAIEAFDEVSDGTYEATVNSSVAGDKTMTARFSVEDLTPLGNDVASFTSGDVDLSAPGTGFVVSTGEVSVAGGEHTVTVTLTDADGNPVTGQELLLAGASADPLGSGGVGDFVESATDGTYEAPVTSSVVGAKTITVEYSGETVTASGNDVGLFVAGDVDLAAPGTGFTVSEGEVSVAGGEHTVTVTLTDADGNPVPGQEASLEGAASGALGSGSVGSFTETGTDGTYEAPVTSSLSGSKTITVEYSGQAVTPSGNAVALFVAGEVDLSAPGTGFDVSTGTVSVAGGEHTVTVTLTDADGNPVPGQESELAGTSSQPLGTGRVEAFFETATAGTYEAVVTSSISGAKTISVEFSGDAVAASGNAVASFTAGAVDVLAPGTGFEVSVGDVSVAGGEHTVTVTLTDADGNPVPGQEASLLGDSSDSLGSGGVGAFTDTGTEGTYVASVTSSVAGAKTITVEHSGDALTASGNDIATFIPGSADVSAPGTGFAVSTGDVSVADGEHTVTVTLTDTDGNAVPGQEGLLSGATVDPLGSGSVGAFIETGTVGTYEAPVTSSVAGPKTITVEYDGDALTANGNVIASFTPGDVDVSAPGTGFDVSTGGVSVAGGEHTVTVTLTDADGNPVSGQELLLVAVSSDSLGSGSVGAFTETGTDGTYEASVTSSVSGPKLITVEYSGDAVTASGNDEALFTAAEVDLTAPGTGFEVSLGDVSVSGGSHTVTVTLTDADGNPVPGQEAFLAGETTDPLGTGVVGAFVETGTDGTYVAQVTSSVAGSKTVTVEYGGDPVTALGNDVAVFAAGGVDVLAPGTGFVVTTGDVSVAGGEHTVTVTLVDADENPVPGQEASLLGASDDALGSGSVSAFTETGTPGTYTATVTSSAAGTKTITVGFTGNAITAAGNDVASFTAGSVDLTAPGTWFSVATGDLAVTSGEHTITVMLTDADDNPVSGQELLLTGATTDPLGSGSVSAFTETATPGMYFGNVGSSIAGTKRITVDFSGDPLAVFDNDLASFTAGSVDLTAPGTGFEVSTGNVSVAGGEHTVTVTLSDAEGNPVQGQESSLEGASSDPLGSGSVTAFTETGTAGTYEAQVTSSVSGGKTITVEYDGDAMTASGNDVASFTAGDVDLTAPGTGFEVSTGDVSVAGGEHTVTVTLTDADDNPVSGQEGSLVGATADLLGTGSVGTFTETATDGTYEAPVTSSVAGAKTITVEYDGGAVTASGNDAASFTSGETDLTAPGTGFDVSSGDVSVAGGEHTVTVTLTDAEGNPVSGQEASLVGATADPLGTGSVGAFAETATDGTYEALVTSSVAGVKTITVEYDGDAVTASGNDAASFTSGETDLTAPGTGFEVSSGDVSVAGGEHTVTVTLTDADDNPVSGQEASLMGATADPLGTGNVGDFSETATDGTYEALVTSSVAGSKTITVEYSGDPVTASGNDVASFTSGETDLTAPGTGFTVSTGDVSVSGGQHTVTVTLTDADGNPVSGQEGSLVGATADPLGTGSVGAFTETATDGTYAARVTSSDAGTKTITVEYSGDSVTALGNDAASFTAGGVDLTAPGTGFTVSAGDVSVAGGEHTVTVTLTDADDNPVPDQEASLTGATVDQLGSGTISGFTETGTEGTYTAQVTSSVAGSKTITVEFGGNTVSAAGNDVATFTPGDVDLNAPGTGFTVSLGDVSVAGGSHTVTVTLSDSDGNPVPDQESLLLAATADPIGTGIIGAFVETGTDGTYVAQVTSSISGLKTITVEYDGDPVTALGNDAASFTAGGVDLTAPGSGFTVSTGDVSVAGGEHTITVTLADADDNPVTGKAPSLLGETAASLGSGNIEAFVETGTDGTYTARMTSSVAGAKTVTVGFAGNAVTALGNDVASFTAGGVDVSAPGTGFTVSSGDVSVAGGSHTVTVTLSDADDNPVANQAALLVGVSPDSLGTGSVGPFVETGTEGTYTAQVTSSIAGAKTITVEYDGDAVTASGNDVASFTAGDVDLTAPGTGFEVSTGDVSVAGGEHTVTVTLTDADDNPVSGQEGSLVGATADSLGTGSVGAFTETATEGTYEAQVTSSVAGSKTITVEYDGGAVTASGNDAASFTSGETDLTAPGTGFTVSTGDVSVAGGEHTVTVTLTDADDNPVSGQETSLVGATADPLGTGSVGAFTETATEGTYEALVTSSIAGAKTITVEYDGDAVTASGNDVASFTAGDVDLTAPGAGFEVSTGDVSVAGGEHTVTVTLTDADDNPVSGQEASLVGATADLLGTGNVGDFSETATDGTYEALVTSSVAGVKTITVEYDGGAVTASGNDAASFTSGETDLTAPGTGFTVSTGDVSVAGGEHTVTVTLTDADGNPVSGQEASLVGATADPLGTGSVGAFTETATDGTYAARVTSSIAGTKTITVEYDGDAVTALGNDAASFTAGNVDLTAPGTGFEVSAGDVSVSGGEHTVTVTLTDADGNPVPGQEASLVGATADPLGTGNVGAFTETATDGTYEALVTSSIAGAKTITVEYSGNPVTASGNSLASFTAGGVDPTAPGTAFVVSTGTVSVAGGEHTITVTLTDADDNPVSGQETSLTGATADPLGTGSVGAFTETATDGTYEAQITSSVSGAKTITVDYSGNEVAASGNDVALFAAGDVDLTSPGTAFSVSVGDVSVSGGSHTVTVTLTDADGNPVVGQAAFLLGASSVSLGTGNVGPFVETGIAGTYTAQVTSSVAGDKTITVEYSGEAVTASGNDVAAFAAGGVDITAPGTGFTVSTGDVSVAGGEHTVTVTLADADDNPVPGQESALTAATVDALGSGGVGAFSETGTEGTYVAQVSSSVAGVKTMTAEFAGSALGALGNDSASFVAGGVDVTAPGSGFTVSTGDVTVVAGSHTVTVTLTDATDNPVPGQAASLVAATANALGTGNIAGFVETATEGTYTAQVTSSVSGAKTITVEYEGTAMTASGNDVASFIAGDTDLTAPGTGFEVSTGDVSVDGGEHTVTVTLTDATDNPVPGREASLLGATVDPVGSGSVGAFAETATAGTYVAQVSSSVAGVKTITVEYEGTGVTASANDTASFSAGEVDLTAPGTGFNVSTGDVSVAGGEHTVTVTLTDANNNAVPGQEASLEGATADPLGTGGIGSFTETATAGTYVAQVSSSVAGVKTITVEYEGAEVTASGNDRASFTAGGVDVTAPGTGFSVSTGEVSVAGGEHTVTVTLTDADDNPVPGQEASLEGATVDPLGTGSVGSFTETATEGTYEAKVTSSVIGAKTITVEYSGDAVTASGNDAALFAAGDADPSAPGTAFEVSTGDVSVAGGSHTVTVTLTDADDNPVSGEAASLTGATTDALGTGGVGAFAETATPGTYVAQVTSSVAGSKIMTVDFATKAISPSGNDVAVFTAGGVDLLAPGTGFEVSTGDVSVAGGEHTVTVTLTDADGNPVSGQEPSLAGATADELGTGVLGAFTETGTPGTYVAPITSSVSGAKTITVGFAGNAVTASGNDVASFAAGNVDLTAPGTGFEVSTGDASVSGGEHTITVTLSDADGNPVPGQDLSLTGLTADPLGSGSVRAFNETATPGTYVAQVTSSISGSKTITVEYSGDAVTASGNDIASFTSGGVDVTAPGTGFSVSTGDVSVEGGSHVVTVTLSDADDNPVAGQAASLLGATVDPLGEGTVGAFAETGTAGTYIAKVTSTVAGTKTITVQYSGAAVTVSGNDAAVFTAGVPDPTAPGSRFVVSGGDAAAGAGSHIVAVRLTDTFGNPVSGEQAQLLASTVGDLGGGEITTFSETATPGTYEARVTSTLVGDMPVTVSYGGAPMAADGNDVARFVPDSVDTTDPLTRFSVSLGDQVVGTGQHTITVTLADGDGNAVPGQAAGLSASSLESIGSGAISGFTETAVPGTYEASVSSSVVGAKQLSVRFGGSDLTAEGNQAALFVPGEVDVTNGQTSFTVSGGLQTVSTGSHSITVRLADSFGNPIPGASASLVVVPQSSLGAGSIGVLAESATPGTYEAAITSTVAASIPIDVSYVGQQLQVSGNGAALFGAGPLDPSKTQLTATSGIAADGVAASRVEVRLTDAFGNPIQDERAVKVLTTLGTINGPVYKGDGLYAAEVRSTEAGTATVSVELEGTVLSQTVDIEFAAKTPAPDPTAPDAPVLDPSDGKELTGCAEPGSTVRVLDDEGREIGSAVAGPDCRFKIVFEPALPEGKTITVRTTDPAGNEAPLVTWRIGTPAIRLEMSTMTQGGTQRAYGSNFQPGEDVAGLLRSDPIDLGTLTADKDGRVTFDIAVPQDLAAAAHTVYLTGDRSGTVSEGFLVTQKGTGGSTTGNNTGNNNGPGGLVVTGAQGQALLLWGGIAAGLLGAAVLAIVLIRRTKREEPVADPEADESEREK